MSPSRPFVFCPIFPNVDAGSLGDDFLDAQYRDFPAVPSLRYRSVDRSFVGWWSANRLKIRAELESRFGGEFPVRHFADEPGAGLHLIVDLPGSPFVSRWIDYACATHPKPRWGTAIFLMRYCLVDLADFRPGEPVRVKFSSGSVPVLGFDMDDPSNWPHEDDDDAARAAKAAGWRYEGLPDWAVPAR